MQITITRPDDWHLHLRDGDVLNNIVPHTAQQFARAVIMPNLQPPVTTTHGALAYRERILAAVPQGNGFDPLMTLYLTDTLTAAEIIKAKKSGLVYAAKLYPAGATTNSDAGISNIEKAYDALAAMEECGLPLLIHGEVTSKDIDIFDREAVFIERILTPLVQRFPKLKIILEHITTSHGIDFVKGAGDNVGGTLTAHHLLYNRNDMLAGGIRPHYYCLPILKRETHRLALLEAATSGDAKFFLGTDSAPHTVQTKESACGCAGMYTAHAAIELYAEAFEQAGKLENLEAFASFNGPDFYELPRNTDTITLEKTEWQVPETYNFGDNQVRPLRAGESIAWKLKP